MVTILMMSAEVATLDLLLYENVFLNKDFDVIIFLHDVINKHRLCNVTQIIL